MTNQQLAILVEKYRKSLSEAIGEVDSNMQSVLNEGTAFEKGLSPNGEEEYWQVLHPLLEILYGLGDDIEVLKGDNNA